VLSSRRILVTTSDTSALRADRAMARYAAGDDAAFGELYDELAPLLQRYLARRTRDEALVEDLVQQTFLKMHKGRGRFIPGAPVRPWACSIAVRLLIDCVKHSKVARETFLGDGQEGGEPFEVGSPESELVAHRLLAQLQAAVAALPHRQAQAWHLSRDEGLPPSQIASRLDITENAAKLLVHKALKKIRSAFRERDL
jgi:RNA polymerase sigma-70 factor (ECF subfamily)